MVQSHESAASRELKPKQLKTSYEKACAYIKQCAQDGLWPALKDARTPRKRALGVQSLCAMIAK